ncbi:kinase-like domain-containing protein [Sparassis latifolia]|uniref:Serine/threonine-protein kinase ssp1 n=1 Tax=Sparassis crispa TaxID=139825 RepID=A0A401H0Q3_9APHY|nr:Serine/threonine-protein kinase ssp1 [Sparassis crispa]GBE87959.1 Serine/threonine-protein kinase ssp1 [Sparassis crispa]
MSDVVAASPDIRDTGPVPGPSTNTRNDVLPHTPNPLNQGVVMTHEIKSSYSRSVNRRMINQYEFDHRVGRGQHGEVYLARDTSKNGMEVAIKAVKRKNQKVDRMSMLRKRNLPNSPHLPLTDQLGSTEHKIRKEIAIMKKCCHPHIVRLLEVIDDKLNDRIYMVMEYLGGGEIKWRTQGDEPVLRVDQTRRICRDVILGLEYLHHQGIIHRDIKPANLLWSADRRTVKITDFGVSHFSYAQRLAAAGRGLSPDDQDPILMDDSDLSKTAGTPMFLAPEILSDSTSESASSSTMYLSPTRKKPPITKAIDVWAFGVTLYGLLFGHLPFQALVEYDIYQVIRKQDWDVPATMGVDLIPVGGRHQKSQPKGEETEGYLVVKLLQRLLEKDAKRRITLSEVKKDPWILRDISNPQEWLRETTLDRQSSLEPTADETSSAMSSVRFRWSALLTNRISILLRNVRPQRSFRRGARRVEEPEEFKDVGTRSAPNVHVHHLPRRSTVAGPSQSRLERQQAIQQDRGKQRQLTRDAPHNQSGTEVSVTAVKGFEPWSMWAGGSTPAIQGSGSKPRRGSIPSKVPEMTLQVPVRGFRVGSPQPSPQSISQATSPIGEQRLASEERPRSRMSISSWVRGWRSGKHTPYGASPQDASANTSPGVNAIASATPSVRRSRSGGAAVRERMARRSEDAFNSHITSRQSSASGPLMPPMRAASWGEVNNYSRPSEDMTSLYSGERADDALDEDTLLLGAGGVAQSPVPSIPSGLLSTVSSTNSTTNPAWSAAQAILQRAEIGEHAPVHDQSVPDMSRQSSTRLRTTSPLSQMPYNHRHLTAESDSVDSYDDDSSIFDPDAQSEVDYDDVALQPSTSQMYQAEDDESEDEEEFQLEVRTRRPSASASPSDTSPRNSESTHTERAIVCI